MAAAILILGTWGHGKKEISEFLHDNMPLNGTHSQAERFVPVPVQELITGDTDRDQALLSGGQEATGRTESEKGVGHLAALRCS